MRHRRTERCLLRAQVALEAGRLDEVRETLDEARQLEPLAPQIEELETRLAAARPTPIAPAKRRRGLVYVPLTALGVTALAAGLAFTGWRPQRRVEVPTRPSRPDVVLPAEPTVKSDIIAPAFTLLEPQRPLDGEVERPSAPIEVGQTAVAVPDPVPSAPNSAPAPFPYAPPARVPEPPPAPPTTRPEPVNPGAGLSPVSLPIAAETAPPPAAEPVVDERVRVRAVLSRYEAAYSGLDASAARQVWPGVDERALTRAFEGLASQQLSLGRCDVSVAGANAHADCSGTATWTPKVGGGGRTENRRWQFELSKAGDDWHIVRAVAR